MEKSKTKLTIDTNLSYIKAFVIFFVFLILLILLISRNTQDMADRMFWLDEVYDLIAIIQPFWDIPEFTIKGAFTQPPLFYWIGHFVAKIGTDPVTLRSISFASYIAMIGFVIFALRELRFASRIFLCFVLIMSPFGAFATTEFRPYAMAALSILVSSVLLYRAIKQPSRWLSAVLYGMAALALQYTLTINCFTFVLQMGFLGISILFYCFNDGVKQTLYKYKTLIFVSIPLCISYVFFLKIVFQTGSKLFPTPEFHLFNFIKALFGNLAVIKGDIILIRSWALSFAPACLILGCITGLLKYRWSTFYLIFLFVGQIFFSTFMTFSRIDHPAPQRYFVASYIAFAMLCAIGVEYFFQRISKKTTILVIVCLLVTTLPGGIISFAKSMKTPGFNPITEAIETMRCNNHPTVVLCEPRRNNFVPWYAYRDDPLIIAPHKHKTKKFPFLINPSEDIMEAASKKYCFILIEGPQGNVYKGETYKMLSALPNYSQKRYSITPGHVIPDAAWLFTPSELEANTKKGL